MKTTKQQFFQAIVFCAAVLALTSAMQAQDYNYTDNGDGTATIDQYIGSNTVVSIPTHIAGLTVTAIGVAAFDSSAVTSVTIPNTVTVIGDAAFISSALTSVTIPDSVYWIGEGAFSSCERLTAVTIGNNVTNITDEAFQACQSLASVTIPASVTSIGNDAFDACIRMSAITVDALNPAYSSLNGVLFDKSQATLIQYPAGKTGNNYVIPSGVTSIGWDAFDQSTYLASVTIPGSVTNIGGWAFAANLTSITFLGNAPAAGGGAFYSPATIYYYPGTTGWTNPWQGRPTVMVVTFRISPAGAVVFNGPVGGPFTPLSQSYSLTNSGASPVNWSLINTSAWFNASVTNGTLNPGQTATVVVSATAEANSLPLEAYGVSMVFTNLTGQYAQTRHCSLIVGGFPFTYSINDDGTVTITGYTGTNVSVVIPDTIEGLPVTSIGYQAFFGISLTSIIIPASVTYFVADVYGWSETFGGDGNLTSVTFLGNAPATAQGPFFNSPNVIVYYYPGTTGWSNPWQGVPTAIVSPLQISPLYSWDIYGPVGGPVTPASRSFSITNISAYPETWSLINTCAWLNASVTSGTLNPGDPVTVVQLSLNNSVAVGRYSGTLLFTNLTAQFGQSIPVTLIVGPYNYVINGNFSIGLIPGITITDYVGPGGNVVIPDTIQGLPVRCIWSGFYNKSTITSITIPDSVTLIDDTFQGCTSLTNIIIGSSVSGIYSYYTFGSCPNLTSIYFRGNAPAVIRDYRTGASVIFKDWDDISRSKATLYYKRGATGWTSRWETRPAVAMDNPKVRITGPLKTGGALGNPPLVINGTASGEIGVSRVLVGLDGEPVTNVATFTGSSGNSTNWSYTWTSPLTPGNHTVHAKAVDDVMSLESAITNNTFFFQVYVPLTIVTKTDGVMSSAGSMVKPTKSPIGTPTNGAPLVVGKSYTVTAAPARTSLFSNWVAVVNGASSVLSTSTKLTFTMQSNLTLVANFVTSRFTAAAGSYYGLFSEATEINPISAGFVTVTVTSGTGKPGTCSGNLTLAGKTVRFSGSFVAAGDATIPLAFGFANVTLRLHVPDDGSDTISGSVSNNDGSWTAALKGNRAVFKTSNPATAYAGQYTMVIPGSPDAAAAPGGDGYGLVQVANNGNISLLGNLGNGTMLSQSVPVSKHGDWPLYSAASTGTGTNASVIMGWLSFSGGLGGTVTWVQPPQTNDVYYPQGFTNETDVVASRYYKPVTGVRAITLNNGNGSLLLSGGNLPQVLSNSITLSTLNTFTPGTNYALSLTVATATGKLTGSFTNVATGDVGTPLTGVVLQQQNIGRGYFKGTNQTGALLLQDN